MPPLMQGQGTERTASAAAPVAGDAGAQHFRRRNRLRIDGMGLPAKGQAVEFVHFRRSQGRGRRGQNQGAAVHGLKGPGVAPVHLLFQHLSQSEQLFRFVQQLLMAWQGHQRRVRQRGGRLGGSALGVQFVKPGRAGNSGQHVRARALVPALIPVLIQAAGTFQNSALAHAPDQQVSLGVHKNGAAQGVGPEIVMTDPPQGGFNAAQHQGQAGKGPARQVGVYQAGPVGPRARLAAGGVGIVMAFFTKGRVMGQQGVQGSGADAREQAGPPHGQQVVGAVPAGLGHQAGAEAVMDQPARQQHAAEGRMVHIGVAVDQQHVQFVPAQGEHFFAGHGQKAGLGRGCRSSRTSWMAQSCRMVGPGRGICRIRHFRESAGPPFFIRAARHGPGTRAGVGLSVCACIRRR